MFQANLFANLNQISSEMINLGNVSGQLSIY